MRSKGRADGPDGYRGKSGWVNGARQVYHAFALNAPGVQLFKLAEKVYLCKIISLKKRVAERIRYLFNDNKLTN